MWLGIPYFRKPKLIWKKRTPFQTIHIYDKGNVRYMRFASESWQGALDMRNNNNIMFPYQRFFLAYQAWAPRVRSFLSLGVGSATAIKAIRREFPNALISGVDLDAGVLEAAVKYFNCPSDDSTHLYAMHGRAFLDSHDQKYDLVFLDTFDSYTIPYAMRTIESFSAIKSILEENGLLVVNVIGTVRGPHSASFRALYKTMQQVFGKVWVLPVSRMNRVSQNILLFALNSSAPIEPNSENPRIRKILKRLYRESIPCHDIFVYQDSDRRR